MTDEQLKEIDDMRIETRKVYHKVYYTIKDALTEIEQLELRLWELHRNATISEENHD